VSARSAGWLAAILVTLVTLALIVSGITGAGLREWWNANSLTTDTVAGLLVLLITVLVVNQLLNGRQDAASEDFRTYMMMLLISAPVFIGGTAT
jgi:hypothetical protein